MYVPSSLEIMEIIINIKKFKNLNNVNNKYEIGLVWPAAEEFSNSYLCIVGIFISIFRPIY